MGKILIKHVLLNEKIVDVLIDGNTFSNIQENIEAPDSECTVIDGTDKAIFPPFYNCHTHSPMNLLRGFSDDLELFEWLNEHIWPMEARLEKHDIYVGTKLAALEMIKSGTVFANDMYWYAYESAKAFDEMGMRACIGICTITNGTEPFEQNLKQLIEDTKSGKFSKRLLVAVAPHAIYTCSKDLLIKTHNLATENDLFYHIHCSETPKEVEDSIKANGLTPVGYLNSLGLLTPKTILAHCTHLTKEDIEIIKKTRAVISHQPISNCKLASGAMDFAAVSKARLRLVIGTDGCSSNNSVDMFTEARVAALSAKLKAMDPTVCPTSELFGIVTKNGPEVFGINGGEIAVGKVADCMLIDMNNTRMIPNFNIISNLMSSADQSCVDSVICDGNILMLHRKIAKEEEVLKEAKEVATKLCAIKRELDKERETKKRRL